VDPHVAGALFHGCIRGALAGRTRVLVTHQTQFLPHCDRVIVMEHGFVAFDGTYAEFVAFTANRRDTAKNEEGQQPVAATAADVAGRDVRSPILASGLLPTQQDVDGDDAEVGAAAAQVDPALEGTLQRLVATGAALRGIMSDMQSCAPETKPSVGAAGPMSSTAAATSGSLIQAEEMARGAVPLRLYVWYATRSGFMWPVAGVFLYLLWRAGAQISDMWASLWGSRGSGWGQSEPYTQNEYMKWFVLASGLTAAVFVFRQTVYVYWVTNVASAMHHEVVVKVLAAPMSFFDTTPTGRIMNRFSKDIEAFDVAIPDDLDAAMSLLVNLVGFVVGAIVGVWFIFPLFLLAAVILVLMIRRFGAALRAARRIENVSRSPMLAILTETMGGLRTMRIYGQTQRFSDRHAAATASMLRAVALFRAVQQWSMLRVSCISCVLVLGMGCLTAAVRTSGGIQSIIPDASYALLGLTYMMSLPTTMVYFIGQLPVLEAQMNASERIKEWMDELPQEPRIKYHNGYGAAEERAVTIPTGLPPPPPHKAAAVGHHATEPIASHDVALVAAASDSSPTTEPIELKPVTAVTVVGGDPFAPMPAGHEGADLPAPPRSGPRPPAGWPASGDLRFENVHLRYRPGLPLILRGVTCHIRSGMKVGVVGRTGSGKSTLLLALFRMVDACWGRVLFDGVDTRQLQLSDLRSQMTIIPQEPLLFAGTVRSNLDPFARCSDAQLWEVLDLVALSSARGQQTIAEPIKADEPSDITNNNNAAVGLDAAVVEKGANFSVGQRQLMCLARALLKPSRLLLLDEATASVDQATDKLVQRVLRSGRLDGTTVVTIAHRLATIIDADRVLVMDAGRVAEFDHPSALLRKEPGPGAIFRSMVERLGPAQAAALAAVADGHASVDGIDAGASVYQE
jgi:ABC-type multidrug transport system fused ATPase/permease subunit